MPPTNPYCLPGGGMKGRCLFLSPLLREAVLRYEICGKPFNLYGGMMKSLADGIA